MRLHARFFGLLCGAVVIAIAARYGFKTSDNDFDGYIWAFTYGSVTLGGLFGHSLGVHAWRHSKLVGGLVFAGSALALLISLSNSIGAMAGRGNEQQAERIRVADTVRDTRRSLKRAEEEREALKFEAADEAAVNAARAKASAAAAAKEAECKNIRGQRCRDKETEESAALATLETATRNKAATDRAAKLDADIAALRQKIEKSGPVLEANSQGSALARLFDVPETKAATLSTYQNLAMAMVIEFLIVISLVASEVLEHHETKTPAAPLATEARKPQEAASVMTALSHGEAPKAFPVRSKPRLIASRPDPVGSVVEIMAEIMEPGRGKVEIADVFAAYAEACEVRGKRPIPTNEFPAAIAELCQRLRIEIEDTEDGVFLMRVKLKKPVEHLISKGKQT
jgi:hypothetical protein